MPHVDQPTREFMQVVSDTPIEPKKRHMTGEEIAETALRTARSIAKNPQKYVARKLVAKALVGEDGSEKIATANLDPAAIFHMLTDKYGQEWWDWEPETLWHTLQGEGPVSREQKDLVMALQVTVNTNAPFEHWHIFENIANAFAGNPVDFGILQPVELTDAARAVRILLSLRPKMIFDDEVWGYIAALAKQSGVVYLPDAFFGGSHRPQEILDTLHNDEELRPRVQQRWPNAPKSEDDLALKVQLLRLKEIEEAARA